MRIGANFGLTQYSSVSSAVIRVKAKLQKDKKLKGRLEDIENKIFLRSIVDPIDRTENDR
jgi:hypothetical protein